LSCVHDTHPNNSQSIVCHTLAHCLSAYLGHVPGQELNTTQQKTTGRDAYLTSRYDVHTFELIRVNQITKSPLPHPKKKTECA